MNVLDYLNEKQKGTTPKLLSHPLENSSNHFKYLYCLGLGLIVYGYKQRSKASEQYFCDIMDALQLEDSYQKKVIDSFSGNFNFRLNEIFETLTEKSNQYCFIADLYKLSFWGLLSPTFSQDIIHGYTQIFGFNKEEVSFLKEFCNLGNQSGQKEENRVSSYYNDSLVPSGIKLYHSFRNAGYFISYQLLQYIFPKFSLTEEYGNLLLQNGDTLYFDYPINVNGTVTVKNASTFILEHTTLHISGNFFIENAKLIIKDSTIFVHNCVEEFLFHIQKSPEIILQHCTVYCNQKCSILSQNDGYLKIDQCSFQDCINNYGIVFHGYSAEISMSKFINCQSGAILNHAKNELFLISCTFSHCQNIHGGAIYSDSLHNTTIQNCTFQHCHAKFLGGAIYFVNKKYGQRVIHCSFEDCTPSDSIVFNEYNNDIVDYLT